MAQKKSTATKAKTETATPAPAPKKKAPVQKVTPAPKATQPALAVTMSGIYPIKSDFGASNLKAMPLPGKRVLLILQGSSTVVNDLEIVGKGKSFILR